MADLATPSAATIGTINAGADAPAKGNDVPKTRPEKPDESLYKKELEALEKVNQKAQEAFNAVRAKLDNARPNNKDSPAGKRQKELRDELAGIRQQQSGFKNSRQTTMDKVKSLDEKLKARQAEQKTARSKVNFKSVEDIDREIKRLQADVDKGMMKIVDEKKTLSEITQLNRQRKGFAGFDEAEKGIQAIKTEIADLKKTMDNPEQKELSDKYNKIAKELDEIKAEQDSAFKNLNSMRDERTKLHDEQQKAYLAIKEHKDKFYGQKRAYAEYDREARKVQFERRKAERDAYEAGKRRQQATQRLEEASAPAYGDEINTAEGLIRYFDPNSQEAKAEVAPGKFAASAQRTVDDSGFKGMKAVSKKKEDLEDYFVGGGGKKKGGRKTGKSDSPAPGTPVEGKLNLSIGIFEELAKVDVSPPSSQADVPAVIEKLKERLSHWKKDQDRKTKENISKAQKEIDKLEADAKNADEGSRDEAKKPAQKNAGVNGKVFAEAELDQEKDAINDVAKELEEAKIENANDQ